MRTTVICFSCGSWFWFWVWGFFLIQITFLLLTASNYFIMKNIRRFGYVRNVRAFGKKTWKTDVCCLGLQCN